MRAKSINRAARASKIEKIVFTTINSLFLIILSVIMLYPYLNTLAIAFAFNDGRDSMMGGITVYPRAFTLKNFKTVLSLGSIGSAIFISLARTVTGTLCSVFYLE